MWPRQNSELGRRFLLQSHPERHWRHVLAVRRARRRPVRLASASILACDCGPAGFSSGKSSCEGQIMTECPMRCLGRPVCCEQTDMRIRALTVKKDALNCTLQRFQRAPETKLRHMLATTTVCKTTQLGLKEALRRTKLPEVVCMDCKKKKLCTLL